MVVDVMQAPAKREELSKWSEEVIDLYLEKREQYGDSFSDSAVRFKHPEDDKRAAAIRLFLQREYDKLKRIHSSINKETGKKSEDVIEDAFKDIVGYIHVIRSYLQEHKEIAS